MAVVALVALLCMVPSTRAQEPGSPEGERAEDSGDFVDEDEQYAPRPQTYAFNPVQARKELKVGNYYAKKGSYRAAAGRYEEATRWDTNFGEAYWRLGAVLEKLGRQEEAIAAYASYLRVEPSGKKARSVRHSLEQIQQTMEQLPLSATDSTIR